jgi:D-alanyl-D-alanine carboxypeptidase
MRRAIVWTAAFLAAGLPCASFGGETLVQAPQLEQVVTTALEEFDVPGATVGIWTKKGEWTKALGLANVAAPRPVKLRDHFAIRSVTKSFVVTVVLQLIADGNGSIGLDDPIGNYLPGVPNGNRITLRELANMTSGLFDYTADPEFRQAFGSDPTRTWTTDELLAFAFNGASHEPVNFAPGARYQYSNTNTLVLGKLIEALSGEAFEDVLQEKVLLPLELNDTKYLHGIRLPRPFASGYQGETDAGVPEEAVVSFSALGFAGAMVSTVGDLGNWGPALAEGFLLPTDLQQQRFQTHATAVDPNSPVYDAYGLGMGQVAGWWGHTGTGAGYEAAVFHQIESNQTFVILLNASNTTDVPVRIFCRVLAVLNEAPPIGSDSVCAPGRDGGGRGTTIAIE